MDEMQSGWICLKPQWGDSKTVGKMFTEENNRFDGIGFFFLAMIFLILSGGQKSVLVLYNKCYCTFISSFMHW